MLPENPVESTHQPVPAVVTRGEYIKYAVGVLLHITLPVLFSTSTAAITFCIVVSRKSVSAISPAVQSPSTVVPVPYELFESK